MPKQNPQFEEDILANQEDEVKEPAMYKVLLHNDDYTTMDFVVYVLMHVFHKSSEDATQVMTSVHKNGVGVCGIYPFDIAETKVVAVLQLAQDNEFPLKCTMERE